MANVYVQGVNGGETTTPTGEEGIELDDGSTSTWIKIKNLIGRKLRETSGPTTLSMGAVADGEYLKRDGTNIIGATASASVKGRVELLAVTVPTTVGAPMGQINGGSSPVEGIPYFSFVDGTITYRDFYCRLIDYSGGGLTLNFEVLRTSATAALRYVFEAAIRRINTGTEDITASHTYDYNAVTATTASAAGEVDYAAITFTDGADMDSLAVGESFILRITRDADNGSDDMTGDAYLIAIEIKET